MRSGVKIVKNGSDLFRNFIDSNNELIIDVNHRDRHLPRKQRSQLSETPKLSPSAAAAAAASKNHHISQQRLVSLSMALKHKLSEDGASPFDPLTFSFVLTTNRRSVCVLLLPSHLNSNAAFIYIHSLINSLFLSLRTRLLRILCSKVVSLIQIN